MSFNNYKNYFQDKDEEFEIFIDRKQENISHRFHKVLYTDKNALTENKVYSMFVRKNNIQTNVNPIRMIFEQRNIDNIGVRLIVLFNSYDVIAKDVKHNNAQNLMIEIK